MGPFVINSIAAYLFLNPPHPVPQTEDSTAASPESANKPLLRNGLVTHNHSCPGKRREQNRKVSQICTVFPQGTGKPLPPPLPILLHKLLEIATVTNTPVRSLKASPVGSPQSPRGLARIINFKDDIEEEVTSMRRDMDDTFHLRLNAFERAGSSRHFRTPNYMTEADVSELKEKFIEMEQEYEEKEVVLKEVSEEEKEALPGDFDPFVETIVKF